MHHASHRFEGRITKPVALRYLRYDPAAYDSRGSHRWPLILFLHGSGERGDDLNRVKNNGLPKEIERGRELPAIVVAPQCRSDSWWTFEIDALDALLDELIASAPVDPERIYLTGLSMGGFGTWEWAIRQPQRFAAIAPVCGGAMPTLAPQIAHLPIWAFHGADDQIVPLWFSQRIVDALQALGSAARLTVYPDVGHDSWSQAYADPALYEWLLAQRRASAES